MLNPHEYRGLFDGSLILEKAITDKTSIRHCEEKPKHAFHPRRSLRVLRSSSAQAPRGNLFVKSLLPLPRGGED